MSLRTKTKWIHLIPDAIETSLSWSQAMKKCKVTPSGASYQYFQAKAKELNLDVSHFLGKAANAGEFQTGLCKKKSWKEILICKKSNFREDSLKLRRAYTEYCLENNIPIECKTCHNKGIWFDHPLKLEINHIDENRVNNVPTNLEWLCPNCHSLKTF